MTVLAIDPGSAQSAWVLYNAEGARQFAIAPNDAVRRLLQESLDAFAAESLVIEEIASYGMPVGREVFQTVRWAGRFEETAINAGWPVVHYLPRRDVKLHLCGSARAKDANIRQALLDRFGGAQKAVGCKKTPGPLYGVSKDVWAALALAVTWDDLHGVGQ
jgi:hypothetical protein